MPETFPGKVGISEGVGALSAFSGAGGDSDGGAGTPRGLPVTQCPCVPELWLTPALRQHGTSGVPRTVLSGQVISPFCR